MLTLDGLEIVQGDWRMTADLALEAGSATALLGPSGSGKSTLLAVIAGFLAPARGRVLWRGRDLTPLGPAERPVTLLFQEHNLFPHLTAARNVGLGLRPDLRLDPAGRRVWRGSTELSLSTREFTLLETLMRRSGQVLTRDQLLDLAWGGNHDVASNVVDVYVRYLRAKIDRPFGVDTLRTVRGVGYRLTAESS